MDEALSVVFVPAEVVVVFVEEAMRVLFRSRSAPSMIDRSIIEAWTCRLTWKRRRFCTGMGETMYFLSLRLVGDGSADSIDGQRLKK